MSDNGIRSHSIVDRSCADGFAAGSMPFIAVLPDRYPQPVAKQLIKRPTRNQPYRRANDPAGMDVGSVVVPRKIAPTGRADR